MNFDTNYIPYNRENGVTRENSEKKSEYSRPEETNGFVPKEISTDFQAHVPPPAYIKPTIPLRSLEIKGTSRTPDVNLNPLKGVFEITGRSIPEDSIGFYQEITAWLKRMSDQHTFDKEVEFVFELEYFNTSSSKCLLDVFKQINNMYQLGKPVSIKWRYDEDDEDLQETGEDYRDLLNLPFILEGVEY